MTFEQMNMISDICLITSGLLLIISLWLWIEQNLGAAYKFTRSYKKYQKKCRIKKTYKDKDNVLDSEETVLLKKS